MESEVNGFAVDQNKKRQRKKKKNSRFLRNAKGFAKQGIYGRGTHIDDDQYNYFINILDAMKNGFEDVEEKVNMANNVFAQTNEQEIHLASNQIVCKVLESLIGFVDAENLERFFNVFADNFRPICSDRFASHVLQKMVEIAFLRALGKASLKNVGEADDNTDAADQPSAPKRLKTEVTAFSEESYNAESDFSADHRKQCSKFVDRVSKFLLNNLEDFVWDPCANHIMRTSILSLAGVHVAKVAFEKGGADMAKNRKLYNVPDEWLDVLKEFPQRLEMWPQFSDFPFQELSSALLGVICIALRATDKQLLKHFGKKILMEAFLKVEHIGEEKDKKIEILDDDEESSEKIEEVGSKNAEGAEEEKPTVKLPKVFEYQSSVILLETLITIAGPKLLTQLYAMLFTGRLSLLAKEQLTNFAVQKLLQHIKEKEDFENVFNELVNDIEDLLKIGHTGVVETLVGACLRIGSKQAQSIVSLQTALHTPASDKQKVKSFFHCLIKLKPYEVTQADNSAFVHLHGSLIVQHILRFNKPIFLVNCILDTPAEQLVTIFNTPNGSHIVDAFLQSKYIGEKSREKFIRYMEGFYVDLATSKFGSRVVDSCFVAAQEAQKGRIVKELAEKTNMLKSTPFGRLLYNKFRVETYRLSATQWKASFHANKEQRVDKLFKDIVN
ncbi:nucleolar protein 9 [Bactrocera tryoni]|uniref:nucleolar protein 9 n=1 Tax=Bactrocera tryoni TaxID=59916 RepID=UPI001A976314|nr:nucleolar protein 9 [Bactrocera tryoni]